jgi:hypothetical protein
VNFPRVSSAKRHLVIINGHAHSLSRSTGQGSASLTFCQVNERVVVSHLLAEVYYTKLLEDDDNDTSSTTSSTRSSATTKNDSDKNDAKDDDDPLDVTDLEDNDLLVFCGHACVYLLATRDAASRAIISRLRPVEWVSAPLYSFPFSQNDTVEKLVSNFSPYDRLVTSAQKVGIRPEVGLVFWPKGPAKDCIEFAAGACIIYVE